MTELYPTSRNKSIPLFLLVLVLLFFVTQASAQDDADVLMQLVPDQVKSGEQFTVLMQIRNSGTTTWSAAKGYRLASRTKNSWGKSAVAIEEGKRIAPGETVTFKFQATAPLGSASHPFQWQMRKGNMWFGQSSSKVTINVADYKGIPDDSDFVYQNIPAEMFTSQVYTAVIHFKNVGHTAWMPGLYQLKPTQTQDSLVWGIDQVDLKAIVRPGEFYTFRFNVIAPSTPGTYPFQWRMHHNSGGNFGDVSEQTSINVLPAM